MDAEKTKKLAQMSSVQKIKSAAKADNDAELLRQLGRLLREARNLGRQDSFSKSSQTQQL